MEASISAKTGSDLLITTFLVVGGRADPCSEDLMLFDLRNFITGCLAQFFTLEKDRSDHRTPLVRVRQAFGILRQLMRTTVGLVG